MGALDTKQFRRRLAVRGLDPRRAAVTGAASVVAVAAWRHGVSSTFVALGAVLAAAAIGASIRWRPYPQRVILAAAPSCRS